MERLFSLITQLEILPGKRKDRLARLRVMEKVEKKFRSSAGKEKPRKVLPNARKRRETLSGPQIQTGGVLREINMKVLERLDGTAVFIPGFSNPLRNNRQPTLCIRKENAQPIGFTDIVILQNERIAGERASHYTRKMARSIERRNERPRRASTSRAKGCAMRRRYAPVL
jgi:hypothetical protein